jgi:hypothetical protein
MGNRRDAYRVFVGRGHLRERGNLEDLGIDGNMILKLSLKRSVGGRTGFIWLRIGTGVGLW